MKVIKAGKTKKNWRFVCSGCGAVLEVEKDDLYVVNTAVAYAGETWDPALRFNCPVCEEANDATDSEIPDRVKWELFSKARSGNSSEES